MSFNITALSFSATTLLCALITWRTFRVWRARRENQVAMAFFKTLLFLCLYLATRAIASLFFVNSPGILTLAYILSHVFDAIALAFMVKVAVLSFFSPSSSNVAFIIVLLLFSVDIILNIFLPNQPFFNPELNIVEWGTNKYVAIYDSLLAGSIILGTATFFSYKAFEHWQNYIIRSRSLLISIGLFFAGLTLMPRHIFQAPLYMVFSDLAFILTFGLVLWGVSFGDKEKEAINKNKIAKKRP